MAITDNPLLIGLSGSIGKQIVFKNYGHCTVVTKYPDMSRVIRTPLQKRKNKIFAEAVLYAQSILRDPEKLKKYTSTLKPGERTYNAAIREYMNAKKGISADKPNTKDERRRSLINTKDERRRSGLITAKSNLFIKKEKKWSMVGSKGLTHTPLQCNYKNLCVLRRHQPEPISMNIYNFDG